MTTPRDPLYAGYRYPAELIGYAVWLYFRFPLSLRMVEAMLAARGISVTSYSLNARAPHAAIVRSHFCLHENHTIFSGYPAAGIHRICEASTEPTFSLGDERGVTP